MPRKPYIAVEMPKIALDPDLAAKVNLLLLDPTRNRMRWGAWRNLIARLLTRWVEEQEINPREADGLRLSRVRDMNERNQA
jgi:hypothetical protein